MRRFVLFALLAFLSAFSTTLAAVLTARENASAVWTGTEMIVWGGDDPDSGTYFGDGFRYDIATNEWTAISSTGAPSPRTFHTAVWTGHEMIVWGGYDGVEGLGDGARYDPSTDTWTSVSSVSAPLARADHTAVWTGIEMIVWGGSRGRLDHKGSYLDTGAKYDPILDRWTPTSMTGAPAPRSAHTAVWTGTEMIVWAGRVHGRNAGGFDATGGRYDPASDTWTEVSTDNAPLRRWMHSAVWTGTEMIVWGGRAKSNYGLTIGGRYDPATDTWVRTSQAKHLAWRHTAIWTGTEMLVWGGRQYAAGWNGVRYDPVTDIWSQLPARGGFPEGVLDYAAVWTGDRMIVWGGLTPQPDYSASSTGGVFDPVTNHWTAMSSEVGE